MGLVTLQDTTIFMGNQVEYPIEWYGDHALSVTRIRVGSVDGIHAEADVYPKLQAIDVYVYDGGGIEECNQILECMQLDYFEFGAPYTKLLYVMAGMVLAASNQLLPSA